MNFAVHSEHHQQTANDRKWRSKVTMRTIRTWPLNQMTETRHRRFGWQWLIHCDERVEVETPMKSRRWAIFLSGEHGGKRWWWAKWWTHWWARWHSGKHTAAVQFNPISFNLKALNHRIRIVITFTFRDAVYKMRNLHTKVGEKSCGGRLIVRDYVWGCKHTRSVRRSSWGSFEGFLKDFLKDFL